MNEMDFFVFVFGFFGWTFCFVSSLLAEREGENLVLRSVASELFLLFYYSSNLDETKQQVDRTPIRVPG